MVAQGADSLVLRRDADDVASDTVLSLSTASRIEARIGPRSWWWLLGGVATGFGVAFEYAEAQARREVDACRAAGKSDMCELSYIGVPIIAVGGAIIGAAAALYIRRAHWERVWAEPDMPARDPPCCVKYPGRDSNSYIPKDGGF